MKPRRTTLGQVADAAGVSIATVSKVLNNRGDVSIETRRRVEKHLRASSYRRVGASSAQPQRPSQQIEVMLGGPQNAYAMAVLDGITASAQLEGFDVVYSRGSSGQADGDRRGRAVGLSAGRRHLPHHGCERPGVQEAVRGRLPGRRRRSAAHRGNALHLHRRDQLHRVRSAPPSTCCPSGTVGSGMPAGRPRSSAARPGCRATPRRCAERVSRSTTRLVTHVPFDYEAGLQAGQDLLGLADPPTAVFAASDEIALGIIEEARRRGLRVPQDLSVVGFDDTFLAARATPPLTTVAQPLIEMGQLAVRSLAQVIANDRIGTSHIELATRLVVRGVRVPARSLIAEGRAAGRLATSRRPGRA